MKTKYSHTIVGGTFDRFHLGHEKLLNTAFEQSVHVTIGISTEKLYKNKLLANTIEDYKQREKYIREYINKNKLDERAYYISIDNIYGTSLTDKDIDAIIVTEDNVNTANLINQKRSEIGFSQLEIITFPFVTGNDGEVISSGRIRKGEIDRKGNSYQSFFADTSLVLPETLRTVLREPIGTITQNLQSIKNADKSVPMIIAVGDIVALSFFSFGSQADVSVVDFKTRRHELHGDDEISLNALNPTFSCKNPAGKIEKEAVLILRKAIEEFIQTGIKQTIKIIGEEDLMTLPAILFAPLQSVVVYGQYDQGAVIVEVTEQKKQEIAQLLKKFEVS
jgi:pantetheine-phosphate adenylyltransferase